MTADTDAVARILAGAQDVDLPEGMARTQAPDDGDPGPDPQDADLEPDHGLGEDDLPPGGEPVDPDLLRQAAAFDRNDLGNGKRLVLHFGENLMFVPRVGWHVWEGRVWQVDPDMIATRKKAQNLPDLVLREVPYIVLADEKMAAIARFDALRQELTALYAETGDDGKRPDDVEAKIRRIEGEMRTIEALRASLSKIRTAHRTFARSSGNTAKIKAAITEAEVPLAQTVEQLDTRPLDVNTQTGVVRFTVTPRPGTYPLVDMAPIPHDRALRMTKIMTCGYDPDATAPTFHAFLDRIMPASEMQGFLQRWFGYSMLGLTNEQALAFFYGMGANGKSALTDLMAKLMGSYSATAKIESLTGQNRRSGGDATPDLISIVAARMVRAAEPEKGVQWQEGLIKQLTGGEPILVRALNENFFEATPIFKLTISGNHAPDIRGMDDGIWRRLLIVPFDVQIPKAERDPLIVDKMLAEGPGILNWLIEGAIAYLEGGLAPPTQVSSATEELRQDADLYGKFLDEACEVTGDDRDSISSRELMLAFMFWQMRRGETPFKERTITTNMKDHSRRWRSPRTGKQFTARETGRFVGYDGLKLSDLFRKEWDAAPKDQTGRALATTTTGGRADDDRAGDYRDF